MAIAHVQTDTYQVAGDGTQSFSITHPGGSDVLLVIAFNSTADWGEHVSSLTYNSGAADGTPGGRHAVGSREQEIHYWINPTTGTNTIAWSGFTNANSPIVVLVEWFTGIDQTTPVIGPDTVDAINGAFTTVNHTALTAGADEHLYGATTNSDITTWPGMGTNVTLLGQDRTDTPVGDAESGTMWATAGHDVLDHASTMGGNWISSALVLNPASAGAPVLGDADFNLPVPTITGLGDGENRGIADFSMPSLAITGVGNIPIDGIADFNLPILAITGIGNIPIDGIADFNLPVPTVTGIGGGRIGSADFNLPILTITGIGTRGDGTGVADFNLPVITITGIGDTLSRFGIANFNLPNLILTGIGNIPIDGTADFNLPSLDIPAIGDILVKGVSDFDLPNLGLSATGVVGALSTVDGIADFNLPSLWINTQGGVDIPMVNIFSTSGQTGAETGTAFTLQRKAGTWFINRDVLAQVILGSGSATIHIEVSLDGGSTFADIVSSGTASAIHAFNLPPIIRVRLSAATAATVNVWLDADLVVTRVNN